MTPRPLSLRASLVVPTECHVPILFTPFECRFRGWFPDISPTVTKRDDQYSIPPLSPIIFVSRLSSQKEPVQWSKVWFQGMIRVLNMMRAVRPTVLIDTCNGDMWVYDLAVDEVFPAVIETIPIVDLVSVRQEPSCRFKVFARPARRFVSVHDLVGMTHRQGQREEHQRFRPHFFPRQRNL